MQNICVNTIGSLDLIGGYCMDDYTPFLHDTDLNDKLTENDVSILVNKQFINLQEQNHPPELAEIEKDEIEIIGRKVSCGSVWCECCFVKKGGSQRFAERLSLLNYSATRQVILTIDRKKFKDGQQCYEALKEAGAVHQFIHNLERTSKIKIKDWVWVLEWHKGGFPHWHVFIETKTGKQGQIGNEILLKHWKYGMVRESYIKTQKHWDRFTKYFAENGYFNPRHDKSSKDKSHQLKLPEWALNVSYRIRKTGSKAGMKKKKETELKEQQGQDQEKKKPVRKRESGKAYKNVIESCGKMTSCYIRRNGDSMFYEYFNDLYIDLNPLKEKHTSYNTILNIPYKEFLQKAGSYVEGLGYVVTTSLKDFFDNFLINKPIESSAMY